MARYGRSQSPNLCHVKAKSGAKRDSGIKALPTDLTSIQSHIRAKIRPITRDGFHTAVVENGHWTGPLVSDHRWPL